MGDFWFDQPAQKWEQAIPIGNGRLGAMVFGGIKRERLALNQDSIWYGGPVDRINPEAHGHLEQVRALLFDGRIPEAEKLLKNTFSGTPQSQRPYQSLGDLTLNYTYQEDGAAPADAEETPNGYRRELNLEEGIVTEQYTAGRVRVCKHIFSSYPHGVIVMHMETEGGSISLDALLTRKRFYDHTGKLDEQTIYMDGNLGKDGICWISGLRAQVRGGRAYVLGERLLIEQAREITLYLGCETSFYEKDPNTALKERLDRAAADGYEILKNAHRKDYGALFGQLTLRLEAQQQDSSADSCLVPLDRRMEEGKRTGFDPAFAALYFQYGRYLLISCSRPGSLPANLQGLWNESMEPAWDSKYTININTEMNYWPAESGSLSECHLPLFDHLLRMWDNGKRTAREMYGCRGFVAHHNTDIWGDCAPQDIYIPATYWVMGGAWLCTHIWTHYLYTQDLAFLRKMYPILEDSVLFFHDFLVWRDGAYRTCPSVSPENTYILPDGTRGCAGVGVTMDNEILMDLFEDYLKASAILGMQNGKTERTKELLEGLAPLRIGKHGQLMEWREDYEEQEPGHRHISQLYALHPSHRITPEKTPLLAQAAQKTLERRLSYGGGHTGWSCAWIINFYARLRDGGKALENLYKLWKQSTFPNLMDNHPRGDGYVFQIDGNFGATAAILEMLVQCDGETVFLLPALPAEWTNGEISGVSLPYGGKLSMTWENAKVTNYRIVPEIPLKVKDCSQN